MREALPLIGAADRRKVRSLMRKRRRQLSAAQRSTANAAICRRIRSVGAYLRARHIGIFLAFDGEPDLRALINDAVKRGKRVYAPVISGDRMRFHALADTAGFARNSFGIEEPSGTESIDARFLDLVVTPLVAFDSTGARIGVGGGYYDRCFRFEVHRQIWLKPKLLGVAYSFQEVPPIEREWWDVPLWGVTTDKDFRIFTG